MYKLRCAPRTFPLGTLSGTNAYSPAQRTLHCPALRAVRTPQLFEPSAFPSSRSHVAFAVPVLRSSLRELSGAHAIDRGQPYSASARIRSDGRIRGSLAILGFHWFSLGFLRCPLVFLRFRPWRPYGPTLWQDSYCMYRGKRRPPTENK